MKLDTDGYKLYSFSVTKCTILLLKYTICWLASPIAVLFLLLQTSAKPAMKTHLLASIYWGDTVWYCCNPLYFCVCFFLKILYQLQKLFKARLEPVPQANGVVHFYCDPTFWAKNVSNLGEGCCHILTIVKPTTAHFRNGGV